MLTALNSAASRLPLVAEDLGVITPEVVALRRQFALPGMRVLQFGFDGAPDNPHLPYNFSPDCVVYTGTHDNDTSLGWYRSLDPGTARRVDAMLGAAAADMPAALVRAALSSVAVLAVIPMQDLLTLGTEARFNVPGTVGGNWRWRLSVGTLTATVAASLREWSALFGR